MSKPPLDYRGPAQRDDRRPQVRWRTIVSCSLLGIALVCGLAALVWPQRHDQLFAAAISLGITGVIIYFPYQRFH